MKKIYIKIITLILASNLLQLGLFAQLVNLEVQIVQAERTGYGDCLLCGNPDPAWVMGGNTNAVDGSKTLTTWTYTYSEMGGTVYGGSFTDQIISHNSTSATSFTLTLDAWENDCDPMNSYNTGCNFGFNSDFKRCTNSNVLTVNFRNVAPCAYTNVTTNYCGDFRYQVRYRWTYADAPTLSGETPLNQMRCNGTAAAPLHVTSNTDGQGRIMNRWYIWQVANNANGPFSDITATQNVSTNTVATVSYTPPQISGSRYYRLKSTSNCSADYNSNTSYSQVFTVTYAFVASGAYTTASGFPSGLGTGDVAPDIQSPICGSLVSSSQSVTLGTLLPPQPGHATNVSSYTWSAVSGTPTVGSGSTFLWTSPVSLGVTSISLTYNFTGCSNPATVTCATTVSDPSCSFVYVSPTGTNSPTAGGPSNPCQTLTGTDGALDRAAALGVKHIKMLVGSYTETGIIVMTTGLTIEGRFVKNGSIWEKNSSTAGNTTLTCSGSESVSGVCHTVGVKACKQLVNHRFEYYYL